MTPGKTGILPENKFPIIADVAAGRQRRFGFTPKIWALTRRQTQIPRLVRPKTEAPTKGRVIETALRDVPRLWTRRERRILPFHSVIKSTQPAGYRNATRITGSPDYRIERVLLVVVGPVDEVEQRIRRGLIPNCRDIFIN